MNPERYRAEIVLELAALKEIGVRVNKKTMQYAQNFPEADMNMGFSEAADLCMMMGRLK